MTAVASLPADTAWMPPAEHWDNLAYERDRKAKKTRGRVAPRDSRFSSARRRFTSLVLDSLLSGLICGVGVLVAISTGVQLAVVPFAIGPFIWNVLAWRNGQTPAKQLLRMYVVHDGKPASWKRMAAREILAKGAVGLVCGLIYGVALRLPLAASLPTILVTFGCYFFWVVWDPENQALWDHLVHTHVVEEREAF